MSPRQSTKIQSTFDDLKARNNSNSNLGPNEALEASTQQLVKELMESTEQAIRTESFNLDAISRGIKNLEIRDTPLESLRAQLVQDPRASAQDIPDLATNVITETNKLRGMLSNYASELEPGFTGLTRGLAAWDDVGRARFGESVSDPRIQKMSDRIGEVQDVARARLRAGGSNVKDLRKYNLPQQWNAAKMRAKGDIDVAKSNFINKVEPNLSKSLMVNGLGRQLTTQERRELLSNVWNTALGVGDDSRLVGATGHVTTGYKASRALHFDTYQQWKDVFDQFGQGDVPSAIIGHIDDMAREIALVDKLGPNYNATYEVLEARTGSEKGKTLFSFLASNRALFNDSKGSFDPIHSVLAANIGRTVRSITNIVRLPLSGITTVADQATTLRQIQLLGGSYKEYVFPHLVNILTPFGSKDSTEIAAHLGYGMDIKVQGARREFTRHMTERSADSIGSNFLEQAEHASFNVSGTNRFTRLNKRDSALDFNRIIAKEAGKPLGDVSAEVKYYLDQYNIGSKEWDTIRATATVFPGEVTYINTAAITDNKIYANFNGIVNAFQERATPGPTAVTRGLAAEAGAPGSPGGELFRIGRQFGSTPLVQLLNLIDSYDEGAGTTINKVGRLVSYGTATLFFGTTVVLLKDLLGRGEIPTLARFTKIDLYWEALAEGGLFGPISDVVGNITSSRDTFGSLGPGPALVDTLIRYFYATGKDFLEGGLTRRNTIDLLEQLHPLRVPVLRVLMSELLSATLRNPNDPQQRAQWNRQEKKLKERGNRAIFPRP